MSAAKEVIERVSRRLVDQDPGYRYEVWDKIDLLGALNNALSVIGRERPSLFGKLETFSLPEDGILETPCSSFRPPFVLLDKNGKRIRSLSSAEESSSVQDLQLCAGDKGGPLYFWSRSDTTAEAWPTDDLRKGYKVRGWCVLVPQLTDDGAEVPVPNDWTAVLEELMLYYANAYDQESVSAQSRAKLHWANALTIMGAKGGDNN
jgi:hypothetical protein